ncbi:thioredoxin family protein, partial [Streptococcus suis]
ADARPEIRFAKLDADALREIASSLNVGGLPATIIFRDGSVVGQIIGAKPRMLFEHEIAKYLDA